MKKQKTVLQKAIWYFGIVLAVIITIVIYAYGFKVTKVNLEETKSERRQTQLIRIIRALAQPDLVDVEESEVIVEAQIMVPCPAEGYSRQVEDTGSPYLIVTPPCGSPGDEVIIEGFHFEGNSDGPVNFIPPSEVRLPLGQLKTDEKGHFLLTGKLPKRNSEEPQLIQAITRKPAGAATISQTVADTWTKIVETVFLALLATTFGTLFAVPLSFFAAKNLMKDMRSPLISVSLNLIAIPAGFYIGIKLAGWIGEVGNWYTGQIFLSILTVLLIPFIAYIGIRWALPPVEEIKPPVKIRFARNIILFTVALLIILELIILSKLMIPGGKAAAGSLGSLNFLATFLSDLGEILSMATPVLAGLAGAGVLSNLADKVGKIIIRKITLTNGKILTILSTCLAGSTILSLIMAGIGWLYQIENQVITLWLPAGLGAAAGGIFSSLKKPKDPMPVGLVIYNIARTVFNALRSIEALIMVIVFVVWVGIGPFAGVLALTLHTIATLAKLYSEQVESILAGPLEAVTATGANKLQTIVYAVIPQIIPPYISFTMYRWDINVRMSTIIGFAGGGGIGFLLIQNINLLNYRAASVQMIAIAIVVSAMDYLSSKMREMVV